MIYLHRYIHWQLQSWHANATFERYLAIITEKLPVGPALLTNSAFLLIHSLQWSKGCKIQLIQELLIRLMSLFISRLARIRIIFTLVALRPLAGCLLLRLVTRWHLGRILNLISVRIHRYRSKRNISFCNCRWRGSKPYK